MKPGEAFGLTHYLAHRSPFGHAVCHVSRGGLEESQHPSGKNWQHCRSWGQARAQIKPTPCLQNVIICRKTSSPAQTCLNFRWACSWGDCIWQACRKWECILDVASSHREMLSMWDKRQCSSKTDSLTTFDNFRLRAWLFKTWISPQGLFLLDCQLFATFSHSDNISEPLSFLGEIFANRWDFTLTSKEWDVWMAGGGGESALGR